MHAWDVCVRRFFDVVYLNSPGSTRTRNILLRTISPIGHVSGLIRRRIRFQRRMCKRGYQIELLFIPSYSSVTETAAGFHFLVIVPLGLVRLYKVYNKNETIFLLAARLKKMNGKFSLRNLAEYTRPSKHLCNLHRK